MGILANDILESFLFLLLTLALYFLYLVNIPLFDEPYGLLAMSDLSDLTQTRWMMGFLYGSVVVCLLLGILLVKWIPGLSFGTQANLWGATFLFLWMDNSFLITEETGGMDFLGSVGIGLVFLYLFFLVLSWLRPQPAPEQAGPWKRRMLQYWAWGWMGFYFGVSLLLAWHYLFGAYSVNPLFPAGATVLCFLHYLLFLFLKNSEGQDIRGSSRNGRVFFGVWACCLLLIWVLRQWLL